MNVSIYDLASRIPPWPPSTTPVRGLRLWRCSAWCRPALLSFVILSMCGCIGRRQAVLVNQTLGASSAPATEQVAALRSWADSEVKAHVDARKLIRSASEELANQGIASAGKRLDFEFAASLAEVDKVAAESVADIHEALVIEHQSLEDTIDKAHKPYSDYLEKLKGLVDQAKTNASEFSGSRDRRSAVLQATASYETSYIVGLRSEYKATLRVIDQLNREEKTARDRIAGIVKQHKARLQSAYEKAVKKLPGAPKPDLGAEPEVPGQGFVNLMNYVGMVKKSADANIDYLNSNSFGVGSFFQGFVQALGKGLMGAVFNPASVKALDGAAVLAKLKDLGNAAIEEFKGDASDIKSSVKTEAGNTVTDFKGQLTGKVNSLLSQVVDKLLK